jgi:thiosulfate/3-mercaptopyruvate sulfurtransferase
VINRKTLHGKAVLWVVLGLVVGSIILWVILRTPSNRPPVADGQPVPVPGPLVDTAWLADNLNNVIVLDVRTDEASFKKRSGGRAGAVNPCGAKARKRPFGVSGHIPGAVLVLWMNLIETRKSGDVDAKSLLPSKGAFEALMQKSGVNNDSSLVITSKGESLGDAPLTTRLYWTLKYFGHDNVAILDGGTARWLKEKRDVEYGSSEAKLGNFKASQARTEIRATTDEVLKVTKEGNTQLVDVRQPEVYLGLSYSAGFAAAHAKGHIPGAKYFPLDLMVNNKDKMKTFYSTADMSQVAALMEVNTDRETIFYGNTAADSSLGWFVWHELLGNKNTRLYEGSMPEWSQDANRPVTALKFE